MAHRILDLKLWGDAKFLSLSPVEPSAQFLWIYLVVGPFTTSLPGLMRVGESAMSEALGWSLEQFRERFRELETNGMAKADWTRRVVWVPKAILYNEPANPNVIKGWKTHWDLIPECQLKREAYHTLKTVACRSKPFEEAFIKTCGNGTGNGSTNSMPNQDQEQEQYQDSPLPPKPDQRPPTFELTDEGLAQEFCFYYVGTSSKERDPRLVAPVIADLRKQGVKPEEIRAWIRDPGRKNREYLWEFTKYWDSPKCQSKAVGSQPETDEQRKTRVLAERAESERRREQARREQAEKRRLAESTAGGQA